MGKKKSPMSGKLRTREHLIADLAVNHVERLALLGNATAERIRSDYGIDLILFTFTTEGEPEPGNIYIQVKATESLRWLQDGTAAFRVQRSDLIGWLSQLLPVILIVYDVKGDRAYWLHAQSHFAGRPDFNLFTAGLSVTVHLDGDQSLEPASARWFAALRDDAQMD
jgi:hypothetical protein